MSRTLLMKSFIIDNFKLIEMCLPNLTLVALLTIRTMVLLNRDTQSMKTHPLLLHLLLRVLLQPGPTTMTPSVQNVYVVTLYIS